MAIMKVGDIYPSNNCSDMEVIEYINSTKVKVRFITTGYERYSEAGSIRCGSVKDRLSPAVYGLGYIGDGRFTSLNTEAYSVWTSMLERCYSSAYLEQNPTYRNCYVCEEWLNFQVFAEYYEETYPRKAKRGDYHLDKDILINGNKLYSPVNCLWATPSEIL